jgi:hypothetical protein
MHAVYMPQQRNLIRTTNCNEARLPSMPSSFAFESRFILNQGEKSQKRRYEEV